MFWYAKSVLATVLLAPAHDLIVAISEAKFKVDSNSAKVSLWSAQDSDWAMIWSNSETSSSSCLISMSNWTPGVNMVSSSSTVVVADEFFVISELFVVVVELGLVRITGGVRLCWPGRIYHRKKINTF